LLSPEAVREVVQAVIDRDAQRASEAWPMPRLGFGLAALPAHHRGTVHAQPFGELLLAQSDCFTALRQALPFTRHKCPVLCVSIATSIHPGQVLRRNVDASFLLGQRMKVRRESTEFADA
jgi:hypothetical protein